LLFYAHFISQTSSQTTILDETLFNIKLEREKIVPKRWDHRQGLSGFCRTCNCSTCPPTPPWRFFPFSSVLKDNILYLMLPPLTIFEYSLTKVKKINYTSHNSYELWRQRDIWRILVVEREENDHVVLSYW